jgi:transposase InsO family protein
VVEHLVLGRTEVTDQPSMYSKAARWSPALVGHERVSMSSRLMVARKDHAPMESFWGSMQIELLNRQKWRTSLELAIAMADYIEHFYNSDRRHSSLSCLTPDEFEDLHSATTQPATLS